MTIPNNGRRKFFSMLGKILTVGGFSSRSHFLQGAPATTRSSPVESEDYYDKLGVGKIINAAGTYTALTASIMPPSVQAAVAQAAKHPVRLMERVTVTFAVD